MDGPLQVDVCKGFAQVVVQFSDAPVNAKLFDVVAFSTLPYRLTAALAAGQLAVSEIATVHSVSPYGTCWPAIVNMAGKLDIWATPPRSTVLPFPKMSQATPTRGPKLYFSG